MNIGYRVLRLKAVLATLFFVLALWTSPARAEVWPSLENYVSKCILIVKAKTIVGKDGILTFRVLESWKGNYSPDLFVKTTSDGRFFARQNEHGVKVMGGQELIFFFTRHNQPVKDKLSRHSTAFPIIKGKVVYASTNKNLRKGYTVKEFKKQILSLVAKQLGTDKKQ